MSLLSTLMAVAITGITVAVITQMNVNSINTQNKARLNQDLVLIRDLIHSRLDCDKTLGPPIQSCAGHPTGSVKLRRKDGGEIAPGGKLGVWSIQAGCIGDELIVGAEKPGRDPLHNQLWSEKDTATDLFRGLSDFCRNTFTPPSVASCPAPYNLPQGADCCRAVSQRQKIYPSGATAMCAPGEFVKTGGGTCRIQPGAPFGGLPPGLTPAQAAAWMLPAGIDVLNNVGYIHTSQGIYVPGAQGWAVDCYGDDAPGNSMWRADAQAMAWAICCRS